MTSLAETQGTLAHATTLPKIPGNDRYEVLSHLDTKRLIYVGASATRYCAILIPLASAKGHSPRLTSGLRIFSPEAVDFEIRGTKNRKATAVIECRFFDRWERLFGKRLSDTKELGLWDELWLSQQGISRDPRLLALQAKPVRRKRRQFGQKDLRPAGQSLPARNETAGHWLVKCRPIPLSAPVLLAGFSAPLRRKEVPLMRAVGPGVSRVRPQVELDSALALAPKKLHDVLHQLPAEPGTFCN